MRDYVSKANLRVVTGTIKSLSDDHTQMVITSAKWNKDTKQEDTIEYQVVSPIPFPEDVYKVGYHVTASGYGSRANIINDEARVLTGNMSADLDTDHTLISGLVKFASMNEEKNADGTPRLKKDGVTPKKPHFDIVVSVKEGETWVNHVIKLYETGNVQAGKSSQLERAQKTFKNFKPGESKVRIAALTTPGQVYTTEKTKDGQTYTNTYSSHMGYKFMDIEFVEDKEKEKKAENKAQAQPQAQAPVNEQAQAPAQPAQANGFSENTPVMEEDEEVMFH